MRKWIITDTHFNHENLRNGKLQPPRPQDYNEQIIYNWNYHIAPDDLVYHLGDVIFGDKSLLKEIMSQLRGTKILIRGNHDKVDIWHPRRNTKPIYDFYTDNGFTAVVDAVIETNHILLSHAPLALSRDIRYNIHGHFHDNDHRFWEPFMKAIYTDRHRLLALEYTNYCPVLLNDVMAGDLTWLKSTDLHKLKDQ